jgi:3'-5' exonuclease
VRARTYSICMKPSVIVWDLETVPDLGGFAAANDLVGKSDVEVREAIGEKFPKHIYHSIVCIGALIAHREPEEDRERADHRVLRQDRGTARNRG